MIGADVQAFVHELLEATGHARDMGELDVDRWRAVLVTISNDEAHAAAAHLIARWDRLAAPTPADFAEARRDLAIRTYLHEARLAVSNAHSHPRI